METVPSPNAQDQEVGPPVDASVNWTDWPTTGLGGEKVNMAWRADDPLTVLLLLA